MTNDAAKWKMGEPVNPKNLGTMAWVPYEEALRYLNVNTFLGRWREYDEHGQERQDRDRIAFCCQNDEGDVLALGADGGELSSPSWRIVDGPDEILVPVPAEEVKGRRVRHKKRGGIYEVIGEAQVQTSQPLEDYEVVVIYRSLNTPDIDDPASPMKGDIWVRPRAEFEDGRFEDVA